MGLSDVWKKQSDTPGSDTAELPPPPDFRGPTESEAPGATLKVLGNTIALTQVIHEGGMGVLYKGHHLKTRREVAVKMLRASLMGDESRQLYNRFRREAKALAQINHANIVRILGCDFASSDEPYIVMEYIDGITLFRFIKRHPNGIPVRLFLHLMAQLCSAFDALHKKGIVHRDLKPDNVMLQRDTNCSLKVLDLGLILFERAMTNTCHLRLTRQGQVVGTPAYMSPEQCTGDTVTKQSDIYSLGLMAYELLAGHPAVDGNSPKDLFLKQLRQTPKPPHELKTDIPRNISDAVMKALAKKPDERHESCLALWKALNHTA